jgi:hypothetical protein
MTFAVRGHTLVTTVRHLRRAQDDTITQAEAACVRQCNRMRAQLFFAEELKCARTATVCVNLNHVVASK